MKIGLVRRGYSPSGGAERYLLRFADALRQAGHGAVLFASRQWPEWDGELVRVAGDAPIQFADALRDSKPREHCDLLFSLERVWECDAYRAGDGVHQAWLERRRAFEPGWKGWFRATRGKHREILDLEQSLFDGGARRIVTNSKMVAGEISRYYRTPPDRIRTVYNGLPARAPTNRRSEKRAELGLKDGECAVLFAGSGWDRKGLRFAIEGVDRAGECTLLVAGAGRRAGLPSSTRTRFLGEAKEMPALMEAADIFLLPTIYDPFSNASLEAMAAGLPVITTAANGFAEIMRPDQDGEVLRSPGDVEGIAAAIAKWTARETPASREARRSEAAKYSIERNVSETLEAILSPAD
ncbi:MAG: glycosyltransferase family 4 protein [Chthoniobacteraceae bacterium]|jgi:UDP-glucose:(heptosyl)LPS alpha-1,3-glucosyltransferase